MGEHTTCHLCLWHHLFRDVCADVVGRKAAPATDPGCWWTGTGLDWLDWLDPVGVAVLPCGEPSFFAVANVAALSLLHTYQNGVRRGGW